MWLIALGGVLVTLVVVFLLVRKPRPKPPIVPPINETPVTDSQIRHLDVVEKFTGLVTQQVLTAAQLVSRSSGRPLADVTARLCQALFGVPSGVDDTAVLALLADVPDCATRAATLHARATVIRHLADTLGGHQEWDFHHVPGQPYDEHRHSPWLDNRPGLPVTAVITPAYVVDEHVLCRQRVTTGAA